MNKNNEMKVCACCVTRIELQCDIEMWVDHYLNYCGFDHLFIYDNDSDCGSLTEIFKDNPNVTVTHLPDDSISGRNNIQETMYWECYENVKNDYDWYYCVDDDEYLWLDKEKYADVKAFLRVMELAGKEQVMVPHQSISYCDNKIPVTRTKPMKTDCLYSSHLYFKHYNMESSFKSFISLKHDWKKCMIHFWYGDNNLKMYREYDDTYIPIQVDNLGVQFLAKFAFHNCGIKLMHYYRRSYNEWERKMRLRDISYTKENYTRQETLNIQFHVKKFLFPKRLADVYYDPFGENL